MLIKGFTGTTLIDFPGRVASIIFVGGCNFRCPFCHNADLVLSFSELPTIEEGEVLEKLKKRKGFIDGVEITGGEPLIYTKIDEFMKKIKALGFELKLDTNGYFPDRLERILKDSLADYIAIDVKTSPEKYDYAVGKKIDFSRIKESIEITMEKAKEYEFRTTAAPKIVELDDFYKIGELIEGAMLYAIQEFRPVKTISPEFMRIKPYPHEFLVEAKRISERYAKRVEIREE